MQPDQLPARRRNRPLLLACLGILLGVTGSHAALIHQWKFNETVGTNLLDSVGAAHAWVVVTNGGGGYQLNGRRIRLDGGARPDADYVEFPETVFDGLTNVTVEVWAVPHSFQTWAHVFDIGPGEAGDPNLQLAYAAFAQGTNGDSQRCGLSGLPPLDTALPSPVDREYHYVMTWSAAGQLSFYRDGALLGTQNTGPRNIATLAALPKTTFWLGRSHFTTNSTANASYNEVRIYDSVLDASAIAADFHRGTEDTIGLLHRWSFAETRRLRRHVHRLGRGAGHRGLRLGRRAGHAGRRRAHHGGLCFLPGPPPRRPH
jgi:hypothetical protein